MDLHTRDDVFDAITLLDNFSALFLAVTVFMLFFATWNCTGGMADCYADKAFGWRVVLVTFPTSMFLFSGALVLRRLRRRPRLIVA